MSAPLDTPFGRLPCVLADSHWCRRVDGWTLSVVRTHKAGDPLAYRAQVANGHLAWQYAYGTTPDAACCALRRVSERASDRHNRDDAWRRVLDRCLALTELVDAAASAA